MRALGHVLNPHRHLLACAYAAHVAHASCPWMSACAVVRLMRPGGKAVLTIPAALAYGPATVGTIPGNSVLQFEVELLEIKEPDGGLFGMFNK